MRKISGIFDNVNEGKNRKYILALKQILFHMGHLTVAVVDKRPDLTRGTEEPATRHKCLVARSF